jgi:hypothetical protein
MEKGSIEVAGGMVNCAALEPRQKESRARRERRRRKSKRGLKSIRRGNNRYG